MDWKCPIIGASVTITDKEQIIDYKDYDITNFICGLCRKNKPLILDNTNIQKQIWNNPLCLTYHHIGRELVFLPYLDGKCMHEYFISSKVQELPVQIIPASMITSVMLSK